MDLVNPPGRALVFGPNPREVRRLETGPRHGKISLRRLMLIYFSGRRAARTRLLLTGYTSQRML